MLLLESASNFYKFKLLFLDQLSNWSENHLAVGARQSPIGLDSDNVVPKQLPPLEFHNYDKIYISLLENTGETLTITIDEDNEDSNTVPYIKGGPLEKEYILNHVHFHWKSEHTIDGRQFPLECHFLHQRSDMNEEEAYSCDKGFCIISVFYELSKCLNPTFEEISEAAQEVCDEVNTRLRCENGICFQTLLPKYRTSYFTYEGSLTTKPFKENVIWIVMEEPGRIGRLQYKALTGLTNKRFEPIKRNNRDLQNINDREIIYTSSFFSKIRKGIRKFQQGAFKSNE